MYSARDGPPCSPRHDRATSLPMPDVSTGSKPSSPRNAHRPQSTLEHSPSKFKAKSALLRKLRGVTPDEVERTEAVGDGHTLPEFSSQLLTGSDDSHATTPHLPASLATTPRLPEGSGEKQAWTPSSIDGGARIVVEIGWFPIGTLTLLQAELPGDLRSTLLRVLGVFFSEEPDVYICAQLSELSTNCRAALLTVLSELRTRDKGWRGAVTGSQELNVHKKKGTLGILRVLCAVPTSKRCAE
jgi:hypothetical protein